MPREGEPKAFPWKPMQPIIRQKNLRQSGITLIELVFALAISLVVLLVVMVAYFAGIRTFTQELNRFDIFWGAQQGLDTITEEIKDCLDVTAADSHSITIWWRDLNDNASKEAEEVVSYSLTAGQLIRTQGGVSKVIAKNVEGFQLEYDNPAYPTFVTVSLSMSKGDNQVTLEAKADIRNR